jgi:nucleotide-binding universal stress UspA family protein
VSINRYSPTADAFPGGSATAELHGPILVASDGSESSEAALTAAALLARSTGTDVEVVSVVEPLVLPLHAPESMAPLVQAQDQLEIERERRVSAQVSRHAGPDARWLTHVEIGKPAVTVAEVARSRMAALVVAGFGQHSIIVRMFGTETPLKIARIADVPVLSVPEGFARLPRIAIVAVDFGRECARAAMAARALLAEVRHVYLVHVKARDRLDMPPSVLSEWEQVYEAEVNDAFARVTETLALPPDVGVTTALLRGTPARELLSFAASANADLLVAGHGHRGRIDRLIGGSVASQLFRGAQCALLLAPDVPAGVSIAVAQNVETESLGERTRWPADLLRFTERNVGRAVTLEIDDSRLGAQVVARGYPLAGVDYDWRDDAVELSFGDPVSGRPHFTHMVRGPISIAIQRDAGRRDRVLRIARPDGQSLVSFEDEG